jgi:phage FluMu protein Com
MTLHSTSTKTDIRPKCWRCERVLAELASRPWRFMCSKCKAINNSPPMEMSDT